MMFSMVSYFRETLGPRGRKMNQMFGYRPSKPMTGSSILRSPLSVSLVSIPT